MLTLRGWIHGLGGAAAVTIGVVVAALIAAGLTGFRGGDSHVKVPATPQRIPLGSNSGIGAALASSSNQSGTRTSTDSRAARGKAQTRVLADGSGPLAVSPGGTTAPKPRRPGGSGGDGRDTSSPVSGTPSTSTPAPGGGSPGSPGSPGGGGGTAQQPTSLGGAVKDTTQQLGDTVNGATQTVGDTVGAVSPVLGNTVKQTGPAVGDTVKGTGDLVGNTVDGLLGGHH